MADITLKQGDTWPTLQGAASTASGAEDLSTADAITVIIDGPVHLEKTAVAIDPASNDGNNWEVTWADTDLDTTGDYNVEVEVVWDDASTPPKIQTYPNSGYNTLAIEPDLGGTD
jgi:hypothetical protein